MNSLDAVAEVLQRAGKPLHYRDIAQLTLESGLWTAVMSISQIGQARNGEESTKRPHTLV